MQLDRTHVKVRARTIAEIGDLSLLLVRRYGGALLIGFTLGVLPWAILNALLLGPIPLREVADGIIDEQTYSERTRYVWLMGALVFLQTPLAGIFTTYYIGQAVFEKRPTWTSVVRACRKMAAPAIGVLGIMRGPLPLMALLVTNWGQPLAPGREVAWVIAILLYAVVVRAVRPFLPEILLLERCPVFQRRGAAINAGRRSRLLHGPIAGDLMGRFFMVSGIVALLSLSLFYGLIAVRGFLSTQWTWTMEVGSLAIPDVMLLWVPLAMWLVAGMTVFLRFLCYLDARIRLEGWEVELLVRAEALRQFGTERSPVLSPPAEEVAA